MSRGHVDLLDHRGVVARRDKKTVADLVQALPFEASKTDGDKSEPSRGG